MNLSHELFSALLKWYDEHKRVLPWRGTPSPYEVWISEIMLQQTRVEAVKDYFTRWINEFPNVQSLVNSEEERILKLWEGLGYYSRARNIRKAAIIIVEKHNGKLPENKKDLQNLPGIGAYTAGAILSIAYGICEPAVDGNVLRVVSRLKTDPFNINDEKVRASVANELRPFMIPGKTSDFTQALFELGALVCLPGSDCRCDRCPLSEFCEAFRQGRQNEFPMKFPKKEKREEDITVFILKYHDKYALRKRENKGLLAGLYEFPNTTGRLSKEETERLFDGKVAPLPTGKHIFTHIVWNLSGFFIELKTPPQNEDLIFVSVNELNEKYSLPTAFSTFKKFIN